MGLNKVRYSNLTWFPAWLCSLFATSDLLSPSKES